MSLGLKKESSGHPGQVDFPSGQVIFHSLLPDGQEIGQLKLAEVRQNLRASWPEVKLEFKFVSSPGQVSLKENVCRVMRIEDKIKPCSFHKRSAASFSLMIDFRVVF